jgi:hypothetical protein
MRTVSHVALLFAVIGCGGSQPSLAPHPQGYATRMQAADQHAQRAEDHRQAIHPPPTSGTGSPLDYQCGDRDMSDQLTSGGQRMLPEVPCWDPAEEHDQRERALAEREQHRADAERRAATRLVEAELAACRGISPGEAGHSPFAHRREIAEVIPHRERGEIRGVRIVFKPVMGLSVGWMEQAIACHRARFERLGEPPTYLTDDPTLVRGATTTVAVHGGHLEVLVVTHDDVAAHVALARAQDLLRPLTAGR